MVGMPLSAGFVLGAYEVEKVLGAGGFGITYLAREQATGRHVAIKEFFPRNAAARDGAGRVWINDHKNEEVFNRGLDRFWEEAQVLARFRHPHIVQVVQRFHGNGTAYIVLEFIEGMSLEHWCVQARRGPGQEQLEQFLARLVDALEVMHRNDFLHRDLAPKNILLREDGLPVLIDFGSARLLNSGKAMTAMVTPNYAPYEQHLTSGQGQGPWTDIYGAAATVYRVIWGRPPMDAVTRAMDDSQHVPFAKHSEGRYRRQFLDALDWGLEVHSRDRPQSIAQWRGPLLEGMSLAKGLSGLSADSTQPEEPALLERLRTLFSARG